MSAILKGVRVLEVSNFVSGPWTCQMLGEYGADIIKIENPSGGDPFRSFSPDRYSATFRAHNFHKRSLTLDLSTERGAEVFRTLASKADVVVENFRPGAMDKLGLGWDDLSRINPRLIYCSISGFGSTGPYHRRPAYDTVIQALSGLLGQFLSPDRPRIAGPNVADSVTSLNAVSGILAALYDRSQTERGAHVEVPMLDSVVAFCTNAVAQYFATGKTPGPYQRPSQSQCFVFRCADGRLISVHMSTPQKFWEALLKTIGRPELKQDARFATNAARIQNFEVLGDVLAPSFLAKSRKEWEQALALSDVPYAPVNDFEELVHDPHVRHRAMFFGIQHAVMGMQSCQSRPVSFNGKRDFAAAPPPLLGEHTDTILTEAGFSLGDIEKLRTAKVV